jgi:4-amino-4-deoxy-L-arabinose transferase-like glycosyltransferase
VLVPVVVALALRLAFVAATPDYLPLRHDDSIYDRMSCQIREQGLFPPYRQATRVQPSAYRPPVFPYFLAGIRTLTGCTPAQRPTTKSAWPRIVGALLGAALVAMVAWLGARWWNRGAGFAAGMITAVFGAAVIVDSQLLSEGLFALLLVTAVLAAMRARDCAGARRLWWAAVAGLTVGLAALTRSNGALVIPVLAAGVWVGRPRWRWRAVATPVVVLLVAALTIAPWSLRNLRDLHAFIPISDEAGGTLAGTYNGVAHADTRAPATWHPAKAVPAERALLRYAKRVDLAENVLQDRLRRLALDYLGAHPGYVAEVGYWNMLRLTGLAGQREFLRNARSLKLPAWPVRVAMATAAWTAVLALLAVVTGAARRSPRFVWVGAALVAVTTIFVNADALRFQVPLAPFEALLAGAGVVWLLERADGLRGRGDASSAGR